MDEIKGTVLNARDMKGISVSSSQDITNDCLKVAAQTDADCLDMKCLISDNGNPIAYGICKAMLGVCACVQV